MVELGYRGRRRLLWVVNVLALTGIGLCIYAAIAEPLAVGTGEIGAGNSQATHTAPPAGGPSSVGSLPEYAVIYGRDLRRPLYDPKPVKVEKPKPKPKPERKLQVKLVGTAVDPGSTYGLFRDKRGRVSLVGVGEKIADAEVTEITDGSATVKFDGKIITLRVPEKKKP